MSLVTAIKISLNFVERQIFNQIGLQINPGDRIGLVGPNGSGKTTLLRIIMGEITPDAGEIKIAKNSRTGYLAQDVQEAVSGSLLQSVLSAIPQRLKLEKGLRTKLNDPLKRATDELDQNTLGKQIANMHQEINRLNLDFPHHEAEKILLGLGFGVPDFQKPVIRAQRRLENAGGPGKAPVPETRPAPFRRTHQSSGHAFGQVA